MEILYQDHALWVAVKPPELLSEQAPNQKGFADLLAEQNHGYVGVIHRLDMGVGGVMVYAKTAESASKLSAMVQAHQFQKEYLAIVCGKPAAESDMLRDLLFHDRYANKTYVTNSQRKGVKEASLEYRLLSTIQAEEYGTLSLLAIKLHTGRTHQIRVQFASRGLPLLGDRKYGCRHKTPIGLFSHALSFAHPKSGQPLQFRQMPSGFPWNLFDDPKNVQD